jgi:hypothetical protein
MYFNPLSVGLKGKKRGLIKSEEPAAAAAAAAATFWN